MFVVALETHWMNSVFFVAALVAVEDLPGEVRKAIEQQMSSALPEAATHSFLEGGRLLLRVMLAAVPWALIGFSLAVYLTLQRAAQWRLRDPHAPRAPVSGFCIDVCIFAALHSLSSLATSPAPSEATCTQWYAHGAQYAFNCSSVPSGVVSTWLTMDDDLQRLLHAYAVLNLSVGCLRLGYFGLLPFSRPAGCLPTPDEKSSFYDPDMQEADVSSQVRLKGAKFHWARKLHVEASRVLFRLSVVVSTANRWFVQLLLNEYAESDAGLGIQAVRTRDTSIWLRLTFVLATLTWQRARAYYTYHDAGDRMWFAWDGVVQLLQLGLGLSLFPRGMAGDKAALFWMAVVLLFALGNSMLTVLRLMLLEHTDGVHVHLPAARVPLEIVVKLSGLPTRIAAELTRAQEAVIVRSS